MSDVFERFAPIAARERAAMERGDTLGVVMARLRAEGIRAIEALVVLRQIKLIPFGCAKMIVDDAYHGNGPDLEIDDLALLASVPAYCKAASWLAWWLHTAIVRREKIYRVRVEERDQVKRAIAEEPAWAREIAIVRDDDDVFEIRFVRVR